MTLLHVLLHLSDSKKVSEKSSPMSPTSPPGAEPSPTADPAALALALINRLKTFTLPTGRMPAAREMALRLEPLKDADSGTILAALQDFERELIALGGAPDPELAETVAAVESAFPGAHLVEVRKLQ